MEQEKNHAFADQPVTISENEKVTTAAKVMHEMKIGCLIVVNQQQSMVGILSERDILRWTATARPESYGARAKDIMSRQIVACEIGASSEEMRNMMTCHKIRHLPIVEKGVPIGVISIRDLPIQKQPAGLLGKIAQLFIH
jgi:CBS domain-containing protein